MAEIIEWLKHQNEPVAGCKCGGTEFHILLNAFGDKYTKIIGTRCTNPDCLEVIRWVTKPKEDDIEVELQKV